MSPAPHSGGIELIVFRFLFLLSKDSGLADELVKILKQAKQNVPDFLAVGGTGGGGGDYQQKQFGGRDIRSTSSAAPAAHGGGGEDEEW